MNEEDRQAIAISYEEVLIITYPNYPKKYDDLDCKEWIISTSPGANVIVDITDLQVTIVVQTSRVVPYRYFFAFFHRLSQMNHVLLMLFEFMMVKTRTESCLMNSVVVSSCVLFLILLPIILFTWHSLLTSLFLTRASLRSLQSV